MKESVVLERLATVLLVLWVVGLVTGFPPGLAIHVLGVGGIGVLYFHRRALARSKADFEISPSGMLTHVIGKRPSVTRSATKTAAKSSRPSAAA